MSNKQPNISGLQRYQEALRQKDDCSSLLPGGAQTIMVLRDLLLSRQSVKLAGLGTFVWLPLNSRTPTGLPFSSMRLCFRLEPGVRRKRAEKH